MAAWYNHSKSIFGTFGSFVQKRVWQESPKSIWSFIFCQGSVCETFRMLGHKEF